MVRRLTYLFGFIPLKIDWSEDFYVCADILNCGFMAKFRVRYKRTGEHEFETVVDVNAVTRNQAMLKINENKSAYKELDFGDVQILDVQKVESWQS